MSQTAMRLHTAMRVQVSAAFTARTAAGRALYELDGQPLSPRPGTSVPAAEHLSWHRRQVFKGSRPGCQSATSDSGVSAAARAPISQCVLTGEFAIGLRS